MKEEAKQMIFRVKRYRPERSERQYFQEYKIPYRDDMVVLDGLVYIKESLDGSLTYRWSCRMGVCGSCGATVNGTPRLTCGTLVRELKSSVVTIEPIQNFPIIKDLVVDFDDFMEKLHRVKPWILRQEERPLDQGEYLQKQEEMEAYKQYSMCINCMLCYAACPVYASDRHFIGPAAAALGYRYILDSRDEGRGERMPILFQEGLFDCTFVGECSAVCPKGVDPALALQRLKIEGSIDLLKSLLMPKLKK